MTRLHSEAASFVPTSTIDGVLESAATAAATANDPLEDLFTVDVMKIDIEGLEAEALTGATGLLSNHTRRPCVILFEWNRDAQREQHEQHELGHGEERLLELLDGHGYVLRQHGGKRLVYWRRDELQDGDY